MIVWRPSPFPEMSFKYGDLPCCVGAFNGRKLHGSNSSGAVYRIQADNGKEPLNIPRPQDAPSAEHEHCSFKEQHHPFRGIVARATILPGFWSESPRLKLLSAQSTLKSNRASGYCDDAVYGFQHGKR